MKNLLRSVFILLFYSVLILNSRAESPAGDEKQENMPDIYIVEEGDNLWELSRQYMNDPFKWRIIWEENKYITDPNLIFPGDPITFPGRKAPLPVTVKPPAVTKIKKEIKLLPSHSSPPPPPPEPKKMPVISEYVLASAGFIAQEDDPKGKIIASFDEKLIMGKDDLIYIDIGSNRDAAVGKKYTIYNIKKQVVHPVTNKKYGYLIKILGTIEVKDVQENMSIAVILQSYKEIEIGDKIMNYENLNVPMLDTELKRGKKDIKGYILATKEDRSGLGEDDIVYIDSGLSQGVLPGDEFTAFRFRGEETIAHLISKTEMLPKIVIGSLKVISVRERTATALITDSKQELEVGEKIEYRN